MRYVTLKPQYILRGWSDYKYGLYDLNCQTTDIKMIALTPAQYNTIEMFTAGGISIDDKMLPEGMRKYIQKALEKGYLVECSKDDTLKDYQKYKYSEARYIHTMLWSITGNCNLACRHCYISSGENCYGELSFDKCIEIMDQMLEANIHMVALTGGEPLVRNDFFKIVDALLERHIHILQVFTNGMLVDETFINEFEKRKINPNYFLLSFDGVGCHDWLRGVQGAEKGAIDAIRLLKSRGYDLVVTTSLHAGNISSLMETYELMKELKVDFWKAVPIIDTGNWKKQKNGEIDIDIVYNAYLTLLEQYRKDNAPMDLGLGGYFKCQKNKINAYKIPFINGKCDCNKRNQTLCESTQVFPYLLPDGRVLPCIAMSGSKMENIAPNIFDEGMSMAKALGNSKVEQYTKKTYEELFISNSECGSCEHRFICSGCRANALSCGGFFEKDPLACRFIKGGYEAKVRKIING